MTIAEMIIHAAHGEDPDKLIDELGNESNSNHRPAIFGYVRSIPQVGEKMRAAIPTVGIVDDTHIGINSKQPFTIRVSTPVVEIESIYYPEIVKATTASGRTYVVKVLEQ